MTLTYDTRVSPTPSTAKGGGATPLAPALYVFSPIYTRVATVPALYSSRAACHGDASASSPADSFPALHVISSTQRIT
jgi:hypothetical protein